MTSALNLFFFSWFVILSLMAVLTYSSTKDYYREIDYEVITVSFELALGL
jgi:hypothetical protein